MKKNTLILLLTFIFLTGCEMLRLAPTEIQKQNAYLHQRTTRLAADTAQNENASDQLQALTDLSHLQSQSYTSYFGLPKELPQAYTAQDVLVQSNYDLAAVSLEQSQQRPEIDDVFDQADAVLDLAIGIAAVIGGVCGTKAVRFLKDAKAKSQALKEVIQNNELFKKQNPDSADAFNHAQTSQSPETKILVTEVKT
ncbi:MAG: hypothetical protein PVG93_00175 [Phycisphaerales bacterium]